MGVEDDLSDEQIRAMELRLLGPKKPSSTSVEVRRRRGPKAVAKPKPYIEVKPRLSELGDDWVYDFYLVSERGRHIVRSGMYSDEARAEIKAYQKDGSEVRVVK